MRISVDTPNDGSYEWTLPDVSSDTCLVRISGADSDGNDLLSDTSDAVFSIIPDTSPCGGSWFGSNYSGSHNFTSVTYGDPTFVAVGSGGVILTSTNAVTWTSQTSGTTNDLHSVIYGGSDYLFVAVGAEGIILTSPNGTTWTAADSPTSQTLRSVSYRAGNFTAAGDSGTILTSPDGITWTDISPAYTNTLYGIIYRQGRFVAVGSDGIILTGTDGSNWDTPWSGTARTLRGITYGDNRFVAVGDSGTILTSSNGIDWDSRTAAITCDLLGAAYGNATFVIVGEEGKIVTGYDTGTWNQRASKVRDDLYGVAYGNLYFTAVGEGTIIYSMCEQSAAAANVFNNQKFLQGPGAVFSKRAPGRRRQEINKNTDSKASLNLVSSNGDETLQAGEKLLITWKSEPNPNIEKVTAVKTFNIPVDFPFDVSDRTFEIRYNDTMDEYMGSMKSMEAETGHGPYGGAALTNTSATLTSPTYSRTQSSGMIDTYYIYSHDGKILAEYDQNGTCVRDYIYSGNRLIAEYKPQTNTYYYYMSDQINTTRIITDGNGNVVYSALYGPYGDVQKVWTSTYDPKLKFSGKEREGYSDLDYFGARYYDHNSYRFISVDPIINKKEALSNPQLWNLYAYCKNNPIAFFDLDGRLQVKIDKNITRKERKIIWRGLSKLYKNIRNNPKAKAYFKKFNIDIEKALWPSDSGPKVYVERKSLFTFLLGDKFLGYYNPTSNNITIDDKALISEQSFASTLIHELGHWANDVSDSWGDLNPDLSGVPSFRNPNPKDDPYGYAAEIVTFGFIYFPKWR